MTKDVKTAKENQTLHSVCRVMHDNNVGSVVIVKDEELHSMNKYIEQDLQKQQKQQPQQIPVGMITERDVVNRIAIDPSNVNVSVRELISKPLITIFENSSLMDAIHSMQSKNIRRLVVTDYSSNKKLVGILTDKDIFRTLAKNRDLVSGLSGTATTTEILEKYRTVFIP
jgi:CBS domain-containing protein